MKNKTQVIIVGGGPAGISAGVILARAGKDVVLIERGTFCGSKNVFGGAIYTQPIKEIFPDFETSAPLERNNTKHRYMLLTDTDETTISHSKKEELSNSYTVIRGKFDRWMAEQAKKEGVTVVTETVVKELLVEDKKVIGVKTELEDYYADIVILADGVNSLLAKNYGLRKPIEPKKAALSVKQTLSLSKEKIQDRFNLDENNGAVYTIMGGSMLGITGLGFLYTNIDTISIGVGITLSDLNAGDKAPYVYLEELKQHPTLKPLLKDAEIKEYSAHLIPEGGYNALPQLCFDGLMITGDAASLVNNIHWEGSNLAMLSGKYAALSAIEAIKKNDFSKESLSSYEKRLNESFIMKDMKSYRNVISSIENNSEEFLKFYPEKINEFFATFTSTDGIPKKQKYRNYIIQTLKERNIFNLSADGIKIAKLALEAIL